MPAVPINRIIPVSLVDGPGSRTAVFVQGCNIACAYCHNPETQKLCISCGTCVEVCKMNALSIKNGIVSWQPLNCWQCDNCLRACPNSSSPRVSMMTAEEVFEAVAENRSFIRGITVSGGECSLYPDFLKELFALCRQEHLTCLMDSNGMVDLSKEPELMSLCDGVMLDVKAFDEHTHRCLTGKGNQPVLKNLNFLAQIGKLKEIRLVCHPTETDGEMVIKEAAGILKINPGIRLRLIKFRSYGVRGRLEHTPSTSNEHIESLYRLARGVGFTDVVIT